MSKWEYCTVVNHIWEWFVDPEAEWQKLAQQESKALEPEELAKLREATRSKSFIRYYMPDKVSEVKLSIEEWRQTIARLGLEGWELVAVLHEEATHSDAKELFYYFYFKRPLPD